MMCLHHNGLNGILADEMVRLYSFVAIFFSKSFSLGPRKVAANYFIPLLSQTSPIHSRSTSHHRSHIDSATANSRDGPPTSTSSFSSAPKKNMSTFNYWDSKCILYCDCCI